MQRAATLFALGCIAALLAATAASAGRPSFNPVCNGTKIDPVVSGTYAVPFDDAPGSITITVRETDAGQVFDFFTDDSTAHFVTSVGIKGGTAYDVEPVDATSGNGLHAAMNDHSGYWYDLSYLCFNTVNAGGVG